MKKLIIIITGAFTLLFGVNVKGSTLYTLDTPIVELNNHSLREVFDDGNLVIDGTVEVVYNKYVKSIYNSISVEIGESYYSIKDQKIIAEKYNGVQGSLVLLDNIEFIIYNETIYRDGLYHKTSNIALATKTETAPLYSYGSSSIMTSYVKNVYIIPISKLGLQDKTVQEMDYWFSVYQDLLKDNDRVSQLPNMFIDLFNEITDNFVNGIKGFTQLIYLDGYGLTDLGIISLIVISISAIGVAFYIIRKVIK